MSSYEENCKELLKKKGFRITKARQVVVEILANSSCPLDASEIYNQVSKKNKIDQVSVYRVLETLESLKLVHKIAPKGKYFACKHRDCLDSMHAILVCNKCQDVKEVHIQNELSKDLISNLQSSHNFMPNSHFFQIDGICLSCKKE